MKQKEPVRGLNLSMYENRYLFLKKIKKLSYKRVT